MNMKNPKNLLKNFFFLFFKDQILISPLSQYVIIISILYSITPITLLLLASLIVSINS